MRPLNEMAVRGSFINCSKGEAGRISLPRNLSELPWDDLDFLGWRDPGAPDRGYIVARLDGEDGPTGITLRAPQRIRRSFTKTTVCSLCLTSHPGSGVALLVAPRAGRAGREGNTVGAYVCSDLGCSLYLRKKKDTGLGSGFDETLTVAEKSERVLANLASFVAQVRATA